MSLEALILGPPIPHGAATITSDGTTSSASAANYVTTGTGATTLVMSTADRVCPRYVEIANLDSSIVIYVNVGDSENVPPTPTASSAALFPGTSRIFRIPGGGRRGVSGRVAHLAASGSPARSIQWYP